MGFYLICDRVAFYHLALGCAKEFFARLEYFFN